MSDEKKMLLFVFYGKPSEFGDALTQAAEKIGLTSELLSKLGEAAIKAKKPPETPAS